MVGVVRAVAASRQDDCTPVSKENSPSVSPFTAFIGELIKPMHVCVHAKTHYWSSFFSVFYVFVAGGVAVTCTNVGTLIHMDLETER